jgi:hypothetical protein
LKKPENILISAALRPAPQYWIGLFIDGGAMIDQHLDRAGSNGAGGRFERCHRAFTIAHEAGPEA